MAGNAPLRTCEVGGAETDENRQTSRWIWTAQTRAGKEQLWMNS